MSEYARLKAAAASRKSRRKAHNSTAAAPSKRPAKQSKKRPGEILRTMGTLARRKFVRSLPCSASGLRGNIDNAHVTKDGTEGAGRKGGYRCIAPLNRVVHRMLHDRPEAFRRLFPDFDGAREAEKCEAMWQAVVASRAEA